MDPSPPPPPAAGAGETPPGWILQAQARCLERLARGAPARAVLEILARSFEEACPEARCSVHTLDERGRLRVAAGPSLDPEYLELVDGLEPGPGAGSCGTAAFQGERVVVADTLEDELWAPYRDVARRFGLRSCWSEPVLDREGRVLGTFAIYHGTVRQPTAEELQGIAAAARLAGLALEHEAGLTRVRRLLRALEAAPDAMILTDVEGNILEVNPAFCRITGWSEEEVRGRNPRILKSGKVPAAVYEDLWAQLTRGQTWSGRLINQRKDGSHYHVSATMAPVLDRHGELLGYVGVQRDISSEIEREARLREHARRLAETNRELRRAREQAEAASRAKGEFLANMSHEIRTPLNGILGLVEILEKTRLDADQRDLVETLRTSGDALLQILNDILDWSKIEAGQLLLEPAPFDLREMVEGVAALFAGPAARKGLRLHLDLPADLARRHVGPGDRLRQVLLNLAGNALKFTDDGWVRLGVLEGPTPGTLRFEVEDTGIGIPEEAQDGIFEQFVQADGTTSRRFGGTGLGLAISKRLVELLGGRIGLQSVSGQGSLFWFEVPLPVEDPTPGLRPGALQGQQLFLVEEDETARRLLARDLRALGAEVESHGTLQEALARLHSGPGVDFLLLGGRLGGHRPEEALERIRRDPVLQDLAVGLLDAGLDPGLRERARLLGAAFVLTDPPSRAALVERLAAPASSRDPAQPKETAPLHHRLPRGARVLLVEDHPVNRKVASRLLRELGCEVWQAENGAEALELLGPEAPFDLVLMDCQMPELDGYEATRRLREAEAASGRRRLPVIAMTAHAMQGDREKCLAAGMDDYLTKPVSREALAAVLLRWAAGGTTPSAA